MGRGPRPPRRPEALQGVEGALLQLARRRWRLPAAIGLACALTGVATVPRLLLAGPLGPHSPFTFYVFSIFLTAALAGGRAGVAALLLSSLIGLTWFVEPFGRFAAPPVTYARLFLFACTSGLIIFSVVAMRRALRAVGEARDRELTVAREMGHRVKNLLAVVHGIVVQTGRSATDLEGFRAALEARLDALALAQDLELAAGDLHVAEVVRRAVAPFSDSRIQVDADDGGALSPRLAKGLVLAIHELATNAIKYGALQVPQGRVELRIRPAGEAAARVLWTETGGPPVATPSRQGFGARLIRAAVESEGGNVALDYAPTGVACAFELPVRRA